MGCEVSRLAAVAVVAALLAACTPMGESFIRGQKITPDQLEDFLGVKRHRYGLA